MRIFALVFLSIFILNANADINETRTGFSAFEEDETNTEIKTEKDSNETVQVKEEILIEEPLVPVIEAKQLYQSYFELPKKLFKGQVFTLTIKALSTEENYENLSYDFSNAQGLKRIKTPTIHQKKPPYYYDTFYFQVVGTRVRVPDIMTTLSFLGTTDTVQQKLKGEFIKTVHLNPDKDFSQVLASSFKVLDYKTTQYDKQHNIVVFSAEAKMANLNDFSLNAATKEGIDEFTPNYPYVNFTYFAVVSKQLNELKFSYFNVQTRRFKDIIIPIIVSNDQVTTQTDLAPTQNTHAFAKMIIAGIFSAIGLILALYKRNYWFLILFIIPLFFIAKLAVPIKHICINEGSSIYLLPMHHGTIFEKAPNRFITEALGSSQGFTKIRMLNNQIGWVKDDKLCKN